MNGSSDLDEFASRKKDESPERTRSVLSGGGTTAVRKVQRRSIEETFHSLGHDMLLA
jgi:hypothetical protein